MMYIYICYKFVRRVYSTIQDTTRHILMYTVQYRILHDTYSCVRYTHTHVYSTIPDTTRHIYSCVRYTQV